MVPESMGQLWPLAGPCIPFIMLQKKPPALHTEGCMFLLLSQWLFVARALYLLVTVLTFVHGVPSLAPQFL